MRGGGRGGCWVGIYCGRQTENRSLSNVELANHLAGVEENGRDVDRIDPERYMIMMAVLVVLKFFGLL